MFKKTIRTDLKPLIAFIEILYIYLAVEKIITKFIKEYWHVRRCHNVSAHIPPTIMFLGI
jgi:hypothetical protein